MSRVLLCMLLLLTPCVSAPGHQLPDEEIERRVQISVKPDRVLVEYSLAMNELTLAKELRKHDIKPAAAFPEMWKQYQEIALRALPEKMRVTLDGQPVHLEPVRASYAGWSHRHLTCLLKADLQPRCQRTKIVVTDGNFPDAPGSYRIAMKGRSGAKLENATVPPTVSRAKPVVLANLSDSQRETAARAEGEFSWIESAP